MLSKLVTLAVIVLAGCASAPSHRSEAVYSALQACSAAGYKDNSPEYQQCVSYRLNLAQENADSQRAARSDALLRAGLSILAAQPAPPPVQRPIICRQMNVGVVCE